jgi:hypothetical protein
MVNDDNDDESAFDQLRDLTSVGGVVLIRRPMPVRQIKQRMRGLYEALSRATFGRYNERRL